MHPWPRTLRNCRNGFLEDSLQFTPLHHASNHVHIEKEKLSMKMEKEPYQLFACKPYQFFAILLGCWNYYGPELLKHYHLCNENRLQVTILMVRRVRTHAQARKKHAETCLVICNDPSRSHCHGGSEQHASHRFQSVVGHCRNIVVGQILAVHQQATTTNSWSSSTVHKRIALVVPFLGARYPPDAVSVG